MGSQGDWNPVDTFAIFIALFVKEFYLKNSAYFGYINPPTLFFWGGGGGGGICSVRLFLSRSHILPSLHLLGGL